MSSIRTVSNASLVDTNVLVYIHDPRDRVKQARATAVLERLIDDERGAVGAQSLGEFYRVATQRLPERFSPQQALAEVRRISQYLYVLDLTAPIVLEGCRGAAEHRMSVWDALVWATAKLNQIRYLLTEDAEHGRSLEGVTYLNPFDPGFDLMALSP